MIYIDLDADLNLEDDSGRNIAVLKQGKQRPHVGRVLVAGRPQFWSWAVIDSVEENADSTATVLFRQVSARHAASIGPLVGELPDAV